MRCSTPGPYRMPDVVVNGATLHTRRVGPDDPGASSRPVLVFLHDSLGCDTVWRDFPDRLSAALGCDALVYDRRGYGKSAAFAPEPRRPDYLEREAANLIALLDACHLASAVLVGHSDGGSIALLAAALAPTRVAAVVTEGAHVFVEERTLDGIRAARELLRSTDLRERLVRHHGDKTDAVTSAWIDTWLSPAFRNWNIEHHLPAVRCPTLVLQGAADEFGTMAQVQAIADGVSGPSDRHLIPGAAHTPHREAAEMTVDLTVAFLQREVPSLAPRGPSGRRDDVAGTGAGRIKKS